MHFLLLNCRRCTREKSPKRHKIFIFLDLHGSFIFFLRHDNICPGERYRLRRDSGWIHRRYILEGDIDSIYNVNLYPILSERVTIPSHFSSWCNTIFLKALIKTMRNLNLIFILLLNKRFHFQAWNVSVQAQSLKFLAWNQTFF